VPAKNGGIPTWKYILIVKGIIISSMLLYAVNKYPYIIKRRTSFILFFIKKEYSKGGII